MRLLLAVIFGLGLLNATPALAEIKVFACEPEWKSLAGEIGGDKVEAYSATTASQDPHHIRAKPSLIAKMRNADMVICSGASLEVGWLPILIQKAGNAKMQPGEAGYLMASEYSDILEKPVNIDRSMGDIHPEGNPHVHLNPHNILKVANEIKNRLSQLDENNAGYYKLRLDEFTAKWSSAINKWEQEAASLKGREVIVHHKNLTYLLSWLGLKEVATLEEKPGIPPSSGHLENVLQIARKHKVLAILRTPFAPPDAADWVNGKTKIPTLVLPYTVGSDEKVPDLFTLYDETIRMLKNAEQ